MRYNHNIILFLICLLFACKGDNRPIENGNPMEVEIPEDFLAFYTKFHQDSVYQINHVVFPLSQKPDGGKWEKSEWVLHKPINAQPGDYIMDYANFAGIIRESIRDSLGVFRMERRFSKMNDEWNLIYYDLKTRVFE